MHGRRDILALALTLLHFFGVVLFAGLAMVLVSKSMRELQAFWLLKQVTPSIILAAGLAFGIWVFDRSRLGRAVAPMRWPRIGGLLIFSLVGAALFAGSIMVTYALDGAFPNNNASSILPVARFYPYLAITLVFTGFVQPLLEEAIFRGRMLPVALNALGPVIAPVLISLLFALLHYSHMQTSFVFSLVMCFVARRRGLGECVVAHASHNLCAVLLDAF